MMQKFRTLSIASALLASSTVAVSAQERGGWLSGWLSSILDTIRPTHNVPQHNVPEIDASSGLLAVAAVMAALVLAWEIKRRRA